MEQSILGLFVAQLILNNLTAAMIQGDTITAHLESYSHDDDMIEDFYRIMIKDDSHTIANPERIEILITAKKMLPELPEKRRGHKDWHIANGGKEVE